MKHTLLVLIITIFQVSLFAQSAKEIAQKQIMDLKNGYLIVLVETNQNKIHALEKAKLQSNNHSNIDESIKELKEQSIISRKKIKLAFDSFYVFSKVLFFPDSLYSNKSIPRYFYNDQWELVEKNLEDLPYFYFNKGITQSVGLEAYIIRNHDGNDLKPPFPYYVRRNHIFNSFLNVFDQSKDANRQISSIIKKVQSKLKKFYLTVQQNKTIDESN